MKLRREVRQSSFVKRAKELLAKGENEKSRKVVAEGLDYYTNRIMQSINPYSEMDAGLIIIALRYITKEVEKNNLWAVKFADDLEKLVRAPSVQHESKVKIPNRK